MLVLYITLIVLNFFLSLIPIIKNWKNIANIAFTITSIAILQWMLACYMLWNTENMLFWVKMAFLGPSFLPTSLYVFVTHYPRKIINLTPIKLALLTGISLFFAIASLSNFIIIDIKSMTDVTFNYGHKLWSIYFLSFMSIIFITIYKKINQYTGQDKLKITYIALGIILTISMSVFFNLILPLFGITNLTNIGPLSVSCLIYCSLYAMLKHELMDIKVVIGRSTSFIIITTTIVLSYLTLFSFAKDNNTVLYPGCILLSVIWAFYGAEAQDKLITSATRKFIKGWYDYKIILFKFSQLTHKSSNLSELVNNIYNLFSNDIEIIDIQVFIPEWFDKFKETSKKLIYHPNKQNLETTPFKITPELIKFILKTKESIYDIVDISNKVTNIDPNLTKKGNFILVSYNEEDEIIALIIIGQKLSEKKYTKEDSQLLKTLSNQITPAMQKIKQIRLNGEIEIAQKIQSEIIPQNHVIPNCTTSAYLRSSDEVGGDFYDIHTKNNHNWIILGDVAGHGIGSGMVMLMIQSIFSSLIHSSKLIDPASINKQANKILCQNFERLSEPRPISLVTLHTEDGKTFKFHGNHENLFIYKHNEKKVIHHSINHLPFGIGLTDELKNKCFQSSSISLSEKDVLLLATDGLTEAYKEGNPKKEQFNDTRIKQLLEDIGTESTETIKTNLIENINTFTNKIFLDDITFIIIKHNEIKKVLT
ncbi:hypothetical protein CL647_06860 [bacterium]|nr:hypothetical protein [Actinomycetota bacterium]MBE33780.1 hypothetical protein [bacterium]|tara:strand:- start:3329 stop:5446 length:2118 start_codon:yes stop_codon:yes gene_type:complete